MNFFQALGLLLVYFFFRLTAKILFGGYYYTNVGHALIVILTLGLTVLISKNIFAKGNISFFPLNKVSNKTVILITITFFFLFLFTMVIGEFELMLKKGNDAYFNTQFIFGWSTHMKLYFLGPLIVAPIFEELFTHGILLQGFRKKYSDAISIILSTLIFVSFHFGRAETDFLITDKVSIALFSALIAWVIIKTSNIKLAIFLHFFWNLLNYAFPLLISLTQIDLTNRITFFIFCFVVLLISLAMLVRSFLLMRSGSIFQSA